MNRLYVQLQNERQATYYHETFHRKISIGKTRKTKPVRNGVDIESVQVRFKEIVLLLNESEAKVLEH